MSCAHACTVSKGAGPHAPRLNAQTVGRHAGSRGSPGGQSSQGPCPPGATLLPFLGLPLTRSESGSWVQAPCCLHQPRFPPSPVWAWGGGRGVMSPCAEGNRTLFTQESMNQDRDVKPVRLARALTPGTSPQPSDLRLRRKGNGSLRVLLGVAEVHACKLAGYLRHGRDVSFPRQLSKGTVSVVTRILSDRWERPQPPERHPRGPEGRAL